MCLSSSSSCIDADDMDEVDTVGVIGEGGLVFCSNVVVGRK
jgi:hypothetical protein